MMLKHFTKIIFAFLLFMGFAANALAQSAAEEGHILVSLRMIGHQILLQAGDSTSRILPIEKEGKRYKLQFSSSFHFAPDQLVSMVDSIVTKSGIAKSYLVEVESCEKHQVVYSYEIGNSQKVDLVPCRGRIQPAGCYSIFFTILAANSPGPVQSNLSASPATSDTDKQTAETNTLTAMVIIATLLLIGGAVYFARKKVTPGENSNTADNPNLITLGDYLFDTRNMELRHQEEVVELTSKEADLLLLLHSSANTTLEREHILKAVWGDEGDYVGRTLDVFISKLRKKLEADASLKIVNVRGVGYKLILNE